MVFRQLFKNFILKLTYFGSSFNTLTMKLKTYTYLCCCCLEETISCFYYCIPIMNVHMSDRCISGVYLLTLITVC